MNGGDLESDVWVRKLEEGVSRQEEAEHKLQGSNFRKHRFSRLKVNKLIKFLIIPNMGSGSTKLLTQMGRDNKMCKRKRFVIVIVIIRLHIAMFIVSYREVTVIVIVRLLIDMFIISYREAV